MSVFTWDVIKGRGFGFHMNITPGGKTGGFLNYLGTISGKFCKMGMHMMYIKYNLACNHQAQSLVRILLNKLFNNGVLRGGV